MREYILCSAVKHGEAIVCGRRHSDCYKTILLLNKKTYEDCSFDTARKNQGFLTSTNRFVDRKEAWKIALDSNQIKYGFKVSDRGENSELISENLFGCEE